MAPLLGLLGLAGGALGQDWYFAREGREGQAKVKGLLGEAPDYTPDGGYGNPTPGSGLMADPASIQRQLEFGAGLLSLTPRQRRAAAAIIEPIMGRASQAAQQQAGFAFQAGENRLTREQAHQHWTGSEARITDQFEKGQAFLREQFEFTKEKHGEEQAWREYTFGKEFNLRQATEARQAAAAQYQRMLAQMELQIKGLELQRKLSGMPEVKEGYRGVMLPTGVPTDAPLGPGIMGPVRTDPGQYRQVPVRGTPDWVKAQEGVDKVSTAQETVALYLDHVKQHGFQKTGDLAGEQQQLYKRTQDAVRILRNTGVLNTSELPELKAELPDPQEVLRSPVSQAFVKSHLASLQATFGREQEKLRQRYRGYDLTFYEQPEDRGRSAPPAGSVPLGGRGGYGGRGSGR